MSREALEDAGTSRTLLFAAEDPAHRSSAGDSPISGMEHFTSISEGRATPVGSEADEWEELDFGKGMEVPNWLRDLGSVEPSVIRTRMLDLQSRLGRALQEINKLQGTVSLLHREASIQSLNGAEPDQKEPEPLWKPAWEGFRRGFTLTYFVRAGLSLTTRALQLLRQRRWQDLQGWNLLSEKGLVYREDAVRLGLFIGGFTSIYNFVHAYLERNPDQPSTSHSQACFTAGTLAGLTLVVQDPERRRTLALYMAARAAQCWYNSLKAKGQWSFLSSDLGPTVGDSLLFALVTSQVMYAYVMRPKTLPSGYWKFIVRTGPIHPTALEAVRRNLRGKPLDVSKVNAFIRSQGGAKFLSTPFPRQIPSWVLHPGTTSSFRNIWRAFAGSFRRTFPLYFSISLVPYVVLNLRQAMRNPMRTMLHALAGALRSTSFISSFVALYMASVSLHRKLFKGDFKQLYWLSGLVASSAIFIEKKARRPELALYVLPRAMESALATLIHRRLLPNLPFWEVGLFAVCMGSIMYYREHEPATLSPLLSSLISKIVVGRPSGKPVRSVSMAGLASIPPSAGAATPVLAPKQPADGQMSEGASPLQHMQKLQESSSLEAADAECGPEGGDLGSLPQPTPDPHMRPPQH